MRIFAENPAATYRKVDLDARIEAAAKGDLTRICLEEASSALGQALLALERQPESAPQDALSRAHGIALWLARSVGTENPLRDHLIQFYGGIAAGIRRNMARPSVGEIGQIRVDIADLLEAARA